MFIGVKKDPIAVVIWIKFEKMGLFFEKLYESIFLSIILKNCLKDE